MCKRRDLGEAEGTANVVLLLLQSFNVEYEVGSKCAPHKYVLQMLHGT